MISDQMDEIKGWAAVAAVSRRLRRIPIPRGELLGLAAAVAAVSRRLRRKETSHVHPGPSGAAVAAVSRRLRRWRKVKNVGGAE